jgi:hypothetical protein
MHYTMTGSHKAVGHPFGRSAYSCNPKAKRPWSSAANNTPDPAIEETQRVPLHTNTLLAAPTQLWLDMSCKLEQNRGQGREYRTLD